MTVVISRSLRLSLGDVPALELAQNFYDYKVSGVTSFGATFGRDKQFVAPVEARARQLWHVHLEDDACSSAWDWISENFFAKGFSQDNFTSDTILVYGYAPTAPKSPFLLMNILAPDGHILMNNNEGMRAICFAYDKELMDYRHQMPSSDWIIVQ